LRPATNCSAKAKAAELRSAAKAELTQAPDSVARRLALQVFDFDFFFFFFAMTLSTLPLTCNNNDFSDMNTR
jgi:hypothetical protein